MAEKRKGAELSAETVVKKALLDTDRERAEAILFKANQVASLKRRRLVSEGIARKMIENEIERLTEEIDMERKEKTAFELALDVTEEKIRNELIVGGYINYIKFAEKELIKAKKIPDNDKNIDAFSRELASTRHLLSQFPQLTRMEEIRNLPLSQTMKMLNALERERIDVILKDRGGDKEMEKVLKKKKDFLDAEIKKLRVAIEDDPWVKKHTALRVQIETLLKDKQLGIEKRAGLGEVTVSFPPFDTPMKIYPVPFKLPPIFFLPPKALPQPPITRPDFFNPESWANMLFQIFNENVFSNLLPDIRIELNQTNRNANGWYAHFGQGPSRRLSTFEHRMKDTPYSITFNAYFLGTDFEQWKETVLHEMCHYWMGLLGVKLNRFMMLNSRGHDTDWRMVCCHAMEVYPDIEIKISVPGVMINCDEFKATNYDRPVFIRDAII